MTQDLARIRAFVQVFDSGGFSAAARQYGRSKALLSKYVTDLEDYLGVRLMNRTTRKLSLTEAGEVYYRESSQLLQQLDDLDEFDPEANRVEEALAAIIADKEVPVEKKALFIAAIPADTLKLISNYNLKTALETFAAGEEKTLKAAAAKKLNEIR